MRLIFVFLLVFQLSYIPQAAGGERFDTCSKRLIGTINHPTVRRLGMVGGYILVLAGGVTIVVREVFGYDLNLFQGLVALGGVTILQSTSPFTDPANSIIRQFFMRLSGKKEMHPRSKHSPFLEKRWWITQEQFSNNAQFTVNKFDRLLFRVSVYLESAYIALAEDRRQLAVIQIAGLLRVANFIFPEFVLTDDEVAINAKPFFSDLDSLGVSISDLKALRESVLELLSKEPGEAESLKYYRSVLNLWMGLD